jgi:hypothetical protein
VDEPWVCPKCGFTNEYYAAYCVSCSEVRPAEPTESPTPEQHTTRPDYQWDYEPPSATAEMRRLAEESAPKPVPLAPVPLAPVPTPSSSGRRPLALPKGFGKLVGVVIWVIIVAIVIPAIRCTADSVSTEPTTPWEWTLPETDTYDQLVTLTDVDTARLTLLIAFQAKSQAWLAQGEGDIPTQEYLLADELLAFQGQVANVSTPESEEQRALYWAWTTSLSQLLLAEQALARDANQANLDARTQAWADEATAYQPLYDSYTQGP